MNVCYLDTKKKLLLKNEFENKYDPFLFYFSSELGS
jgi:hypothetical protein